MLNLLQFYKKYALALNFAGKRLECDMAITNYYHSKQLSLVMHE